MINYNLISLFFCMFILSCSQTLSVSSNSNAYPPVFSIDKSKINKGILKVNLPKIRPENMSIMSPNGTLYIIQSKADSIETISNKNFMKNKSIEFEIPNLMGITWKKGKKIKEKVFIDSGEYIIYFANNLETEPENTFNFSEKVIYENS